MTRIILALVLSTLFGCGPKTEKANDNNAVKGQYTAEKNIVDTITLIRRDFSKEIVGNGRLKALRKSDLRFMVNGELSTINVKNGQRVHSGDILATLNRTESKLKLEQAQQRFEKSKVDLSDVLIGFGLGSDTTQAPKDKLEIAYIRSGYITSRNDLEIAKIAIKNTSLIAPFSGKVANINTKTFEQTTGVFCTIIDDNAFDVDFNILESELSFIKIGQNVRVTPFSDQKESYSGVIREINPMVNDRGQINVRAEIANKSSKLIDGMNARIVVEERIHGQLVVPKSAVVVRDGYDVMFRMNEGKSMWTYVSIVASNTTSHIIEPNLQKNAEFNIGDIIITSGNLNLADGSTVEVKSK